MRPRDLSKDESYGSPASYHKSPGFVPELICLVLASTAGTAEPGRTALNLNQIKKNMTLGGVYTRPERHVGVCMKSCAVVRGPASHLHGRLSLSPKQTHQGGAQLLLLGTVPLCHTLAEKSRTELTGKEPEATCGSRSYKWGGFLRLALFPASLSLFHIYVASPENAEAALASLIESLCCGQQFPLDQLVFNEGQF